MERSLSQAVFDEPSLCTKSLSTKVSEAEFALMEERARGAWMRLAEWVREAFWAYVAIVSNSRALRHRSCR